MVNWNFTFSYYLRICMCDSPKFIIKCRHDYRRLPGFLIMINCTELLPILHSMLGRNTACYKEARQQKTQTLSVSLPYFHLKFMCVIIHIFEGHQKLVFSSLIGPWGAKHKKWETVVYNITMKEIDILW